VDERARRVAENEVLFREVNERVIGAARRPSETFEIICECEDESCMDRVPVTTDVYEAVRREPTDFLLRADHVIPAFETVVERWENVVRVRKTGDAGQLARNRDPRP
jgi:hypothetical protein